MTKFMPSKQKYIFRLHYKTEQQLIYHIQIQNKKNISHVTRKVFFFVNENISRETQSVDVCCHTI